MAALDPDGPVPEVPELPMAVPPLPDVPAALPTIVLFEPVVALPLPSVDDPEPLPDVALPAVPELPKVDPLPVVPEVPEAVEPVVPLVPMLPVVPDSVPLPVVEPADVVPGGQGVVEPVLPLEVCATAEPAASAETAIKMLRLFWCNFMKTPG